jgi:hypothetical protein
MAIGELRALPVGRGQIGKVKFIPMGVQGRGGRGIPSSVIKTGVKLPQLEAVKQMKKVRDTSCLQYVFYSYFPAPCLLDDGGAGAGGPHHLSEPIPQE